MLSCVGHPPATLRGMLHTILLVFAFVLFFIGSVWWWAPAPTPDRRLSVISAGLAFWVGAELFGALVR